MIRINVWLFLLQSSLLIECFLKVGEKFRSRALKFPGLISGCTINWLQRWPKDALVAVANHFFSTFDIVCEAEVKNQVIVSMGSIHDGVARSCTDYFERYFLTFLRRVAIAFFKEFELVGKLSKGPQKTGKFNHALQTHIQSRLRLLHGDNLKSYFLYKNS